ncbi:hypothetical protein [Chlorobaculum limnaeum]|nr:hypothetical protein [Chlorobaculum limnaeum]
MKLHVYSAGLMKLKIVPLHVAARQQLLRVEGAASWKSPGGSAAMKFV